MHQNQGTMLGVCPKVTQPLDREVIKYLLVGHIFLAPPYRRCNFHVLFQVGIYLFPCVCRLCLLLHFRFLGSRVCNSVFDHIRNTFVETGVSEEPFSLDVVIPCIFL